MYLEKTVSVESLFLDPNNPRLAAGTSIEPDVPDSKIEAYQSELEKRFTDGDRGTSEDDEGGKDISDLLDSIAKLGFQGIDQVVVRPIAESRGKYVVIEGNRRVSSIKLLLKQDASTEVSKDRGEHGRLLPDVLETLKKIKVLVLDTKGVSPSELNRRINLVLGIRHHVSLLPWDPLPRAFNIFGEYIHEYSLFSKQSIPQNFRSFKKDDGVVGNVAKRLTIGKPEVRDFLRAYIAFCQLRESGNDVRSHHFSLIKELVVDKILQKLYLPEKDYFLEEQSLERLATLAEFSDRDKPGFQKILKDPKSVKKLRELVSHQFASDNSESIKGLAKSNLVSVETKVKSMEDALDEVIAARSREQWVQALEEEIGKLDREKDPLTFDEYPGFGNEREAKDRLWKKVKRIQLIIDSES